MVKGKVILAVDSKFFDNLFEIERKAMQKKIGLTNLSQANFSKMIKGFKLIEPKQDLSKFKRRGIRKTNDKNMF